jgi:hypothetical protein
MEECRVQPIQWNNFDPDLLAYFALFVFLICVECAKEPAFRCENCNKVYKQEGRFRVHLSHCVAGTTSVAVCHAENEISTTDFSELLRQNREMMSIIQKQNETIHVLVAHLSKTGVK